MKPIVIIDDKDNRLQARANDIIRAGYGDYIDFQSEINFLSFDNEANPIVDSSFYVSGVKCIFIHTSLKSDSKVPESSVSKIRLTLSKKLILVVGFSGGTNTDLSIPKLKYEDFERGLITFTRIVEKYDLIFLGAFSNTGMGNFATYLREESKRLLQDPYNLSVTEVVESKYFKGLLKYAGESFSLFTEKYDLSVMKPVELGRICNQLSERKKL